ncbi:hypothetical protein N7510_003518 [Penicillium lagena]|uniref:uncharacterized protein n=1 Tax=Penicillium lagena TaxID=94218 RepID=UPI00253FD3BC|nr:uncharacterized protein N7510_003518 [Penicillium lagena]KAJ5619534.1 hypothetical protein N7510_003518 [Penicillium lagena]
MMPAPMVGGRGPYGTATTLGPMEMLAVTSATRPRSTVPLPSEMRPSPESGHILGINQGSSSGGTARASTTPYSTREASWEQWHPLFSNGSPRRWCHCVHYYFVSVRIYRLISGLSRALPDAPWCERDAQLSCDIIT